MPRVVGYVTPGALGEIDTAVVGSVALWPLAEAPDGWALCDGALYSADDYPDAAALLGDTYGGNGATTFGVPTMTGPTAGVGYIIALEGTMPTFALRITGTLPDAVEGVAYSADLTLVGDYVPPVTVTAAGRPGWMSFSRSGSTIHFSGTPTTDAAAVSFTVVAEDAAGQQATSSQSVAVSATGGSWATWGYTDNATLSAGNQTMHATSGTGRAAAEAPLAGKVYFEIDMAVPENSFDVRAGVVAYAPGSEQLGDDHLGVYGSDSIGIAARDDGFGTRVFIAYQNADNIWSDGVGSSAAGHLRIGFAVDVPTRKMWARVVWAGGDAGWIDGSPVTGTDPLWVVTETKAIYAAASAAKIGGTEQPAATLISDPAEMFGTAPSGFTAGIST